MGEELLNSPSVTPSSMTNISCSNLRGSTDLSQAQPEQPEPTRAHAHAATPAGPYAPRTSTWKLNTPSPRIAALQRKKERKQQDPRFRMKIAAATAKTLSARIGRLARLRNSDKAEKTNQKSYLTGNARTPIKLRLSKGWHMALLSQTKGNRRTLVRLRIYTLLAKPRPTESLSNNQLSPRESIQLPTFKPTEVQAPTMCARMAGVEQRARSNHKGLIPACIFRPLFIISDSVD